MCDVTDDQRVVTTGRRAFLQLVSVRHNLSKRILDVRQRTNCKFVDCHLLMQHVRSDDVDERTALGTRPPKDSLSNISTTRERRQTKHKKDHVA